MRVADIVAPHKVYAAKVRISHPGYTGLIEVTVSAPNFHIARQMIRRQYNVADNVINSIREVKARP